MEMPKKVRSITCWEDLAEHCKKIIKEAPIEAHWEEIELYGMSDQEIIDTAVKIYELTKEKNIKYDENGNYIPYSSRRWHYSHGVSEYGRVDNEFRFCDTINEIFVYGTSEQVDFFNKMLFKTDYGKYV
ncbi:MAG: hypothetical protein ATN35_03605 [Epulopiscium sp. Nele67-Bin004]|nr:MAG: hypothetical protein ATN35_03605 [Epulopiscium sp. Nele67-Bin004]